MKSLYLLSSIAVANLFCTTPLNAMSAGITPKGAPGLPSTYAECLSKKNCSEELGGMQCLIAAQVDEPWQDLCEALQLCDKNQSGDEAGWRECIDNAQGTYEKATEPGAAMGLELYQGQKLPVSTDESGAHYEQFDPEHKGFMNAQE